MEVAKLASARFDADEAFPSDMDIGKVFVDSVVVGQRHRALDASKVEALAESMDALGLQQPISVFMDDEDSAHLIAGLHRLEAARALKWEQIPASFVTLDPARREMWEIAENLFRVDLSKEQRDEHIRRYAELLRQAEAEDAKPRQAVGVSENKGGRGNKGIASQIAEQTGISTRTVQRALSDHPPVKRAHPPQDDADVHERQVAALMSAWNRASADARPVPDKRGHYRTVPDIGGSKLTC